MPKAKAAPAARPRRAGGANRHGTAWLYSVWKAFKKKAWRFLSSVLGATLIALIIFADVEALSGVGKAVQSSAEALAESAMAAALVLGVGANATATVVRASRSAMSSSASLMADFWNGVDILDVRAELLSFRAIADTRALLVSHWNASEINAGGWRTSLSLACWSWCELVQARQATCGVGQQ